MSDRSIDTAPRGQEMARLVDELGQLLRAARARAGLSAQGWSRRAGLSLSTVSSLERGARRPSRTVLARLATALHPGDAVAAAAFTARLVEAAGVSLVDATVPTSVSREMTIAIVRRSLDLLGVDLDDERARAAVVVAIREVTGDQLAIGGPDA